jgi:hypothetical protein
MDGQMNFDSGWEWGYWLSDVVTARASWDPLLSHVMRNYSEGLDSYYREKDDEFDAFRESLYPMSSVFGKHSSRFVDILTAFAEKQSDLIIHGKVGDTPSPDVGVVSGISYLSGKVGINVLRLIDVVFILYFIGVYMFPHMFPHTFPRIFPHTFHTFSNVKIICLQCYRT